MSPDPVSTGHTPSFICLISKSTSLLGQVCLLNWHFPPLHLITVFKALLMSPASSAAKIPFPLSEKDASHQVTLDQALHVQGLNSGDGQIMLPLSGCLIPEHTSATRIQEQACWDLISDVGKQRGRVQLCWVNQVWMRSGHSSTPIKIQSHIHTRTPSVLVFTLDQNNQL